MELPFHKTFPHNLIRRKHSSREVFNARKFINPASPAIASFIQFSFPMAPANSDYPVRPLDVHRQQVSWRTRKTNPEDLPLFTNHLSIKRGSNALMGCFSDPLSLTCVAYPHQFSAVCPLAWNRSGRSEKQFGGCVDFVGLFDSVSHWEGGSGAIWKSCDVERREVSRSMDRDDCIASASIWAVNASLLLLSFESCRCDEKIPG